MNDQFKAGIFVFIGILGLIASVLLLSGESDVFARGDRVFLKMKDVDGLARGSVISLNGLRIGNVVKVEMDELGHMRVEAKIRSPFISSISKDSVAEVRTQGALGDKFIYIKKGTDKETLKNGDELQFRDDPGLFGVISERGSEFELAFDILKETKLMLESVNRDRRLESILSDIQTLSKDSRTLASDLRGALERSKLEDSLQKLNAVITKIEKGEGTLGGLIQDPELHLKLKELVGGSGQKKHLKKIMREAIEN